MWNSAGILLVLIIMIICLHYVVIDIWKQTTHLSNLSSAIKVFPQLNTVASKCFLISNETDVYLLASISTR